MVSGNAAGRIKVRHHTHLLVWRKSKCTEMFVLRAKFSVSKVKFLHKPGLSLYIHELCGLGGLTVVFEKSKRISEMYSLIKSRKAAETSILLIMKLHGKVYLEGHLIKSCPVSLTNYSDEKQTFYLDLQWLWKKITLLLFWLKEE